MKNNLLFFKIEDSQDETTNDCRRAIDDVIEHKMKVEDAKERLQIQSVERLGRFKNGVTRPVLVKFRRFEDRELVRSKCSNLKGSPIGVSPHLPKDIADTRKGLYKVLKEAKAQKKKAYFKYDKLYIDGEEYVPPNKQQQQARA